VAGVVKEFINILISVCKGTSLFPTLLHVPFLRALFHLFLLSSLTSIFIVVAGYGEAKKNVSESAVILEEKFGGIEFSEDGFFPVKDVGNIQFDIAGGKRVIYFSDLEDVVASEVYDSLSREGVIFTNSFIIPWAKEKDLVYVTFLRNFSIRLTRPSFEALLEECRGGKMLVDFKSLIVTAGGTGKQMSFFDLGDSFLFQSTLFSVMIWGVFIFIKVLWYSLMFMGIFFLMNRRLLGKIPFRSFFIMSIYVGFPAVIVAALFPALDLPYLDYETVYYIGFLVYLFPVLGRVQNDINTPTSRSA